MSSTTGIAFLIAADAIASGCSESEVYANVARAAYMDEDAAMFLADPNNPFAALTRDEVVTGLCFAAATKGFDPSLVEFVI